MPLADNLRQSWRFGGEPPKAVLRGFGTIVWILDSRNLQLELIQLLIGYFLISDVGPDHLLITAEGRRQISTRPEFETQQFSHPRLLSLFHISVDLRHRILQRLSMLAYEHDRASSGPLLGPAPRRLQDFIPAVSPAIGGRLSRFSYVLCRAVYRHGVFRDDADDAPARPLEPARFSVKGQRSTFQRASR